MNSEPRSRSIVLVVHALPPEEASGAPLTARGYATALAARGWRVTVLNLGFDAPPWEAARPVRRAGEPFARLEVPLGPWSGSFWPLDAAWRSELPELFDLSTGLGAGGGPPAAWRRLLGLLDPTLLHVVDNVNLPMWVPEVAKQAGIPVVRTVACAEDLCAMIAPVSTLSGVGGYCEAPISVERCAACVASAQTEPFVSFAAVDDPVESSRRSERVRTLLAAKRRRAEIQFDSVFDRVVFASERFRAYFEATLPLSAEKVRLIAMGTEIEPHARPKTPRRGRSGVPLRFVFAGMAGPVKGMPALGEAFRHPDLVQRDDWRLQLAGGGDRSLLGPLPADRRVTDHGLYRPDQLGALLADADVGLSPSYFETFHRVTREYLLAGLPVVGSTAFGITDAVVDGFNGLLFDHAEDGSLRRAILSLLDDPALVEHLAEGAGATKVRSVAEEVDELESLYLELLECEPAQGAAR